MKTLVDARQASERARLPNRLSPFRFVVAFGVVSMLADFVYEGARSIVGPYLATLGRECGSGRRGDRRW